MSVHQHVQAATTPDDDADLARWDDDGAPPAHPRTSPAAWLRVGAELGDRLVALSGRQDLLVTCRPGTRSGAPAAYFPTLGEVEFDAGLFAPLKPHEIHPRIVGDEERYPAAWGVFVHEAAHAAHSVWVAPAGADPRVVEAALLLEESRVEGAHLVTRPTDRPYLRTSARTLVMPDIANPTFQGVEQAAAVAALILGRRDVGILDAGETRAVADLCESVLGLDLLTTLTRIWTAAHRCADHDATAMLTRGQEWCDALDAAAPARPVPANLTDLLSGAVKVVMDSTAATDAADLAAQSAADSAMEAKSKAQAEDRAQRAGRRRAAAATAKSVFNTRGTTVNPDGTPAPYGSPVTGTRRPTAAEQSAAARLSRALRAAAYRERVEERTTSPTPPGRLNMGRALARDAQRAAGSLPTAEPFTHTRRRTSPTPPLRVGIAVDVSGSMRAACAPVASAAWIVARAATLTDPDSRTATIAYDHHLTALTRPTHRAPEHVTTFDANGASHNLGDAIDALDHGLELSRPGTGRLLVIVTDAQYRSDETAHAVTRVKQLTTAGCAVLQLTLTPKSRHLPGTTLLHLPHPFSAPAAIAAAATDAIRRTR
ncbi:VWA domain-containing protein [Streptomyces sp. OfavH-34-F]|uniref:VWA domain-containing protein n=1 Tax=Streptomyces sp. OfavH-34-F TaxID=2917760 RepID=UPI001EF1F86A|nr:VWA domain-containing protein [Streptomyces sp. OfavH-34-F]MCG7523032.1 VWA domain-containing protein [Streptomyces sp. OfavH-34-F]